jgi:uncharacterized membrane protein YkvI
MATTTATTTQTKGGRADKGRAVRVLSYAGAILAILIGSGFATGQEILQYFTSYGWWGILGTGLVVLLLITYVSVEFLLVGQARKFARPSEIFRYYCGKHLGTFFDYFSVLFVFLSFTVMVSGAGAVFQEHYGLSRYVGGIGLSVLVGITVWFGLSNLVDVIGKVGPVIAVVAIALGVLGVVRNPDGLSEGMSLLPTMDLTQASTNWFVAGLSYVGFNMMWLAAFLTAIGKSAPHRKELATGGVLGGAAFGVACIVVAVGLFAHLAEVAGAEIPLLVLAADVAPWLAAGFSVIVLAGIYTSAVPLLWTVSRRFFEDKTLRFKVLTLVLAAVGTVVGLVLPFSQMVNIVYVINGYVGIVLLALMLVRTGTRAVRRQPL